MKNWADDVMREKISIADAMVEVMNLVEDIDYMSALSDKEQIYLYDQEDWLEQMMHMDRQTYMKKHGYILKYRSLNGRDIHYWKKINET